MNLTDHGIGDELQRTEPGIDPARRRALGQFGALVGVLLAGPLRAETYLSVAEAQELIFPGKTLTPHPVSLSAAQQAAIRKVSGVRVRSAELQAWRSAEGDWLLVDQVIGKHEFIDMAVGLDARGAVVGLEVLTYRESYGDEIRNERWRAQFHGKDHRERLELDRQIKNISGATLSCVHVTQGVNRWTATWAEVLSGL